MIGILDSGIGGLSVVNALKSLLPDADMLYFGDTAHAPYGTKSREKIIQFSDQSVKFILNQGVKILVVACNTISSLGADYFRHRYNLPVLDAVTPVVSRLVETSKQNRIGVIGTSATISSRTYEKEIHAILSQATVFSSSIPLLIPLIESGMLKRPETHMMVKKYLYPLKMRNVDTLVMACNHLTLIKKVIQRKIGKQVLLVDSVPVLAESVKMYLAMHSNLYRSLRKKGLCRYFFSDITDDTKITVKRIFGCSGKLELADPKRL